MEKTTLGKLSRARLVNQFTQGGLAKHISHAEELLSTAHNFFELGGISIDVIKLKREGESAFELTETHHSGAQAPRVRV
ncbi:hypothetical protein J3R83DRAFT_9240 [Lanmaoa asiatica]|nr:hypothetical protein J3R83DRAFT_9240 [Lanmaoa asiatica]